MIGSDRCEESITNNLRAMDFEEGCCQSHQMLQTLQKPRFQINKLHSFREISDWSDRYRLEGCHSLSNNLKVKNVEQQYPHFSISLPRQFSERSREESSPTKQKLQLVPVNVKFSHSRSKSKLKEKGAGWNPEKANMSFYQANYEPLSLLYRKKVQENVLRQGPREGLPLILPRSPRGELKLPRTERVSSIVRMMKRNQQMQQMRKKSSQNIEVFRLPD